MPSINALLLFQKRMMAEFFISVILPIRNEAAYIKGCLKAIFAQDYSGEIEILVIDGSSTDKTQEIIQEFISGHPQANIRLLDNPDQFMPPGFNRALRQARGEVIIMLGGHAEIAPDYVRQCVNLLNETDAACVGGAMETIARDTVGQVIALAMSSPFGVGGVAFRIGQAMQMEVDTAVFAAYRREVFEQIGGLDEELIRNQDDEFNYRLRAHGGKILFSPKIRSRYYSRANLGSLWRQYYQYGLYKVRVLQKHPRQMSIRQFAPPLFVLALILSVVLSFSSVFRPLSLVVPILYLFANLAASILTTIRAQKSNQSPFTTYYLLLPFVFAILHLSYGLGFLAGLFKFWNRWGDKLGKTPAWQGEPGG
jgi:glycosyltransferase involved in cell wall biosynthesis